MHIMFPMFCHITVPNEHKSGPSLDATLIDHDGCRLERVGVAGQPKLSRTPARSSVEADAEGQPGMSYTTGTCDM